MGSWGGWLALVAAGAVALSLGALAVTTWFFRRQPEQTEAATQRVADVVLVVPEAMAAPCARWAPAIERRRAGRLAELLQTRSLTRHLLVATLGTLAWAAVVGIAYRVERQALEDSGNLGTIAALLAVVFTILPTLASFALSEDASLFVSAERRTGTSWLRKALAAFLLLLALGAHLWGGYERAVTVDHAERTKVFDDPGIICNRDGESSFRGSDDPSPGENAFVEQQCGRLNEDLLYNFGQGLILAIAAVAIEAIAGLALVTFLLLTMLGAAWVLQGLLGAVPSLVELMAAIVELLRTLLLDLARLLDGVLPGRRTKAHPGPTPPGPKPPAPKPPKPPTPPTPPTPPANHIIVKGRVFSVSTVIGQGGFGVVQVGSAVSQHHQDGIWVVDDGLAIKRPVPNPDPVRHQQNIDQVRNEVRFYAEHARQFNDLPEVLVYDLDPPVIVLRRYPLKSVEHLLFDGPRGARTARLDLPVGVLFGWSLNIVDHLAPLWNKDKVHTDGKPDNLLVTGGASFATWDFRYPYDSGAEGTLLVCDFSTVQLQSHQLKGATRQYAPPEYLDAKGDIDWSAPVTKLGDVYSFLGATMWELATGRTIPSDPRLRTPAVLMATNPRIPDAFARLVCQWASTDPQDRVPGSQGPLERKLHSRLLQQIDTAWTEFCRTGDPDTLVLRRGDAL